MKIGIIGLVSLTIGVGGGAFVGGTRVKNEILAERAQAEADSLAALGSLDAHGLDVGQVEGGVAVALGTEDHSGDPEIPEGPVEATHDLDPGGEGQPPEGTETIAQAPSADTAPQVVDTSGEPASEAAAAARPLPPPQPDSAAIQGAIKLAQIFSAMKAVDAAAVLQEMTDVEVEAILKHMQSRLAGQVLGEFEPERAALLSRVVLKGASGS